MGRGKWTTLLGLVESKVNEKLIEGNTQASTSSKFAPLAPLPPPTSSPIPPPQETLSPGDFPVLDSIATLARGKDTSLNVQTQIPSIPSFSSIAKFTPLPPPVMYASEILGVPSITKQKKAPQQRPSKKESPQLDNKRRKRSTKTSSTIDPRVQIESSAQILPQMANSYLPFQPMEEKSDTLDWGMTSWGVWGQKQYNTDTNLSVNGDYYLNSSLQLLPEDMYDYSNSNPTILRKKSSKKRKQSSSSSSNQNELESISTNSSPHEHGNPIDTTYHSTAGMDLPLNAMLPPSLNFDNSQLGEFINHENSMLMPIFDEFSMM